jgi:hypothetical protein
MSDMLRKFRAYYHFIKRQQKHPRWTPENRPTKLSQDKDIYTPIDAA